MSWGLRRQLPVAVTLTPATHFKECACHSCGIAVGSEEARGLLWGVEPERWASQESNHSPLWRAMMEATDIGSGKSALDVEPLTAADGSTAFDTNVFVHVVGQA